MPDLLSCLTVLGDEAGWPGLFVLTGSEQFGLTGAAQTSSSFVIRALLRS